MVVKMKKHYLLLTQGMALLCLFLLTSPAWSLDQEQGLALAKKSGCLACHSIEKKIVGPAWMDVSKKYQGQAEIRDKLVNKVKTGGKGAWGQVPMPPYSPRVADQDIGALVDFVLSLASK